jgi:NADPH-dependent 2,4-dienoyl-CoA reductase/sulfur reductase-like enzyme
MERVLGPELGRWIQSQHEAQGVVFHLQTTVQRCEQGIVQLENGDSPGVFDLIVAGVGVRPALALAEQAGLAIDHGVVVDRFLQTSDPHIYAAGDIARWPDTLTGAPMRVEHWVVAQSQGQTAASNMLGIKQAYERAPFFWSQHYEATLRYVGYAERWDRIEVDGSIAQGDAAVRYFAGDRLLATATLGRDQQSLADEVAMEQQVVEAFRA